MADGETPIIDPRYAEHSYAERRLVEIINMCHRYDPDDRPTMAEVQQMLEDAIEENERIQLSEPDDETSTGQGGGNSGASS